MNQYFEPRLYPVRFPSRGYAASPNLEAAVEYPAPDADIDDVYDPAENSPATHPYASVSEHVFGVQSQQTEALSAHTDMSMRQRRMLHERHMRDIQMRHLEIQYQMNGAALHASSDGHKRELTLQATLLKLDTERRKEELSYWKDMAELQGKALELAGEAYSLARRRSLLESLEGVLDG